jgi:alpha-tubulin suppressor-like RCC1 family protein
MVATGHMHTCAARKDGKVLCWGGNDTSESGQTIQGWVLQPTEVAGLPPIRKLALGSGFSCVLTVNGRVMCWGDNRRGQLGDGTIGGNRPEARAVVKYEGPELSNVTDIAAGTCHACALASDNIYCWGCNPQEQIGVPLNTAELTSALTVPVTSFSDVRMIAVGEATSHYVTSDQICGWGSNQGYAVSAMPTSTFSTPQCFALGAVEQTVLGADRGCARLTSGAVQCWGFVLGGTTVVYPPGMVSGATSTTTLGGGAWHACIRETSSAVKCWGSNYYGAVGDGTGRDTMSPTAVVNEGGTPVTGVASGGLSASGTALHSCAILNDGSLHCWGWNSRGQVGNEGYYSSQFSATPVRW